MFPIIIGSAPSGKVGLIYTLMLVVVSGFVYFNYAQPAMNKFFKNCAQTQSFNDPFTLLLFNILGAICIILGLVIIAFVAYDYWRNRK
jgi:H+/Cl- antiporter ClcA